jgi:hypothetical protein
MLSGAAGCIVPMLVNLITTPLLLHAFGEAAYDLERRLIRRTAGLFDLFLTTNLSDHERLQSSLGERVELTNIGYCADRFRPREATPVEKERYGTDLLFVGHHEPRTERFVLALVRARIPVRVHGTYWHRAAARKELARIIFPPVDDNEYVERLRNAKVGLGFLSEWNYNQTAGRSFEIPACGTFLLAMRSRQHLESFTEGVEAEFFGSEDELVRKAKNYLCDENKRRAVAAAGLNRCVRSGYSWQKIMGRDWSRLLSKRGLLTGVGEKAT